MPVKRQRGVQIPPSLSALEEEIMRTVWELGECSSAEVCEKHKQKRDLAPTTIRTVLSRLLEKGYLERVPTIERGYRIKPQVSRENFANRLVSRIVSCFFKDSPHLLVSHLLKNGKITEEELHEIERILNKRLRRD